jgi:alanine-synthesizing transaminase
MFSKIAGKLHGQYNALYRLRDELKAQGSDICDLISGNINDQGFIFPQHILEEILVRGSRECQIYHPDSFGRISAREAIAAYYRCLGFTVDPECILLTAGTSLSYWYCFKLLADEGDEILCPCPSYPLFDYIALLSGVKLIPYRLSEARNWAVDLEQLEACISTRTKALVLISPHNPTGHVASSDEIAGLAGVARRHNLAIISDEVFGEFLLRDNSLPRPGGSEAPLVFTLNGFSKMLALPGLKLGWMAVSGDQENIRQALRSLELISDTFLPVNEIVQASVPELFEYGRAVTMEFAQRIRRCWDLTAPYLAQSRHCRYIRPDGGFYVALRLDELEAERVAESALRNDHLLVHPGYFYDMTPNHLVLSFVQKPEIIQDSIPKLMRIVEVQAATCTPESNCGMRD